MPEKFDLIVIGSGPAGEKGAAQAAFFGKRVALIEREPVLGGAATNTGTLPSKTMRETALVLSSFRQRQLYHLDFRGLKQKVTVRDFLGRERIVKETERARVMENLRRHQVSVYMGEASFVDPHTVAIRAQRCPPFEIKGDAILIATGSYPYRPTNFPFHDSRVYDSDTIVNLHEMPATMLVVGGGVVGCEYACMFAALGIQVTLIEKKDRLISSLDNEIADSLRKQMEDRGAKVLLSDSVRSVETGELLEVQLESDAALKVETILVSAGRCSSVESLGLEKLGIASGQRGQLKVNKHYQTSVPHIYAAGDVIGNPSLASTSMEQARLAMVHAFDLKYREQLAPTLPYGIFTIPECSMVGETEQSLLEKKIPYIIGKAHYTQNARGQIIGDEEGFLKLLFHADTMKLLGVHMIGEMATELIHVGLTALLSNATADLFVQTCYNYPTLTEMYKYAAYDALGRKAGKQKGQPPSEKKTYD